MPMAVKKATVPMRKSIRMKHPKKAIEKLRVKSSNRNTRQAKFSKMMEKSSSADVSFELPTSVSSTADTSDTKTASVSSAADTRGPEPASMSLAGGTSGTSTEIAAAANVATSPEETHEPPDNPIERQEPRWKRIRVHALYVSVTHETPATLVAWDGTRFIGEQWSFVGSALHLCEVFSTDRRMHPIYEFHCKMPLNDAARELLDDEECVGTVTKVRGPIRLASGGAVHNMLSSAAE